MNVLISGAASGIGRAAAEHFLLKGHTVFALDKCEAEYPEGIVPMVADITEKESLEGYRRRLEVNGIKLDVIICVAGVHAMASLVEGDFSEIKRLMDINLLGTMLTCRTFHPLLCEKGRIVILTSEVATLEPMPFNGLYNISKTALECYAQALRQELNLLGQSVVTVRPGAVATPLAKGSKDSTAALAEKTELYKKQAKHFSSIVEKFTGTPMPPERLAKTIYKASTARHPRYSYSKHRNPGLVLLGILPKRAQCFVIKLLLNRK